MQQQALNVDPETIQHTNFTGNLKRNINTIFFITEKAKEIILGFSQGTMGVL